MPPKKRSNEAQHRLLVITGLSGSGMSSATNAFEDVGYFCVDNLPVTMITTFARLLAPNSEGVAAIEKAALVINVREGHFLQDLDRELGRIRKRGTQPFVIFFEAADEVLQRRFSETRRPHPTRGKDLLSAIRDERRLMEPVRVGADMIIDTSEHTVHTLRRLIVERFSPSPEGTPLRIQLVSFGHKYGNPREMDLLFDVRHLPNPYFDNELKDFHGGDRRIVSFLKKHQEVNDTVDRFADLLDYLLPFYKREGKSYLTVGVGCTGGKHRSVMVANELKKFLKAKGYVVSVIHRDMQK